MGIHLRTGANMAQKQGLRLGYTAPDFEAKTTKGDVKFHDWIGDSWAILFSHPADFTPVCTTELGEVARLAGEFYKRNVKRIGLSCNSLESHEKWEKDINETQGCTVDFPIIADPERKVAHLYDMLDEQDLTNLDEKGLPFTVRSVYLIDPKKTIRLVLTYPASTGRQFTEVLRCIDSLQLGDKHKIATPVNWKQGDRVIVRADVKTEEAEEIFGKVDVVKPYLRYTSL